MTTYPSKHIAITINRPFEVVYNFLAEPADYPTWANGSGHSFQMVEPFVWTAETANGPVTIYFSAPNAAGILDHRLVAATGDALLVPMRVVPNGTGAEVTITIFQREGITDAYFARDAHIVEQDLETLKRLLESD